MLLYSGTTLTDDLAQYESVHDNTLTVTYQVPDDLATGSYTLRVIEYGHGFDKYSPAITVVDPAAYAAGLLTPSPTTVVTRVGMYHFRSH